MIEKDSHIENVYAWDENFKEIYIGDVPKSENGTKKNYFCLGCKRQMQAVKGDIRKQHFKHHVTPNSTNSKCTYSDETYRHYLAKANAIDLKKIKVPAVYKYSPNKGDEKAFLIKDAAFIEAHSVVNEHYIYENENGEITVSETFDEKEDKYLFIKPDSIFLNKVGKPILIIEFVATHKPDSSKLMKLKRLGIDAIQVNVPKSSPEEIRDLFFKTNRTKWLYNHAENETDYLQLSNSSSGGIFEVNIEQRKLFEEGFNCRKAQLGDFIRTIGRILESEHYREVEQNLNAEIRRVKENTEREAAELDELRTNYSESGIKRYCQRREELTIEQNHFQREVADLEARYYRKRGEIIEEQNEIERDNSIFEFGQNGNQSSAKTIERRIDEERQSIRNLEERIEYDRKRENVEIQDIERAIERERIIIERLPNSNRLEEESITSQFAIQEETIEGDIRTIGRNIYKSEIEFEKDSKRLIEEIENGDFKGDERYSKELGRLDSFKRALELYCKIKKLRDRFDERISN